MFHAAVTSSWPSTVVCCDRFIHGLGLVCVCVCVCVILLGLLHQNIQLRWMESLADLPDGEAGLSCAAWRMRLEGERSKSEHVSVSLRL